MGEFNEVVSVEDPVYLYLESIATDAAYAMKQLKIALSSRVDIKAQDSILRAIDAVERIHSRTK